MPAGTNPRSEISTLQIRVNGADLEPNEMRQVIDATIEQDLVLPDAFSLRVRDVAERPGQGHQLYFPLLDRDRFPIGASIQIGMGHQRAPEPLLKGEITSLELEAQADGSPVLTVRGYDAAYKLHRQRKSRTFVNVSDSDLAAQIAREHGLSIESDSSGDTHVHVFQDNLTDWEFLRARANRIGFELFIDMDQRKLVFRRPAAATAAPEQEFGSNLLRVRLRMSAPAQVEEVIVRGWDPDTKREIEGRARTPSSRAQIDGDSTRTELTRRLGGGTFVLTNQPVRSQPEADALARSVCDEIAGEFIQLEGTCLGESRLRPGQSVRFKNLGQRFDHEYYLSAASHRHAADGYTTHFVVSGRRPSTLTALLGSVSGNAVRGASSNGVGRHQGVVVGLVTNNKDDQHGRVKVRFPWLGQDESHWARIAAPMGGNGRGFFFLPEVGDEVLVAFEHGDVNFPYVVGGLWNGREKPPRNAPDVVGPTGKVNQRILKSRLGHTITLDDSDDQPSITIVDKTGNNTIQLDSTTNRLLARVQGDISLEAQGQVMIKGMQGVAIESPGPTKVKGATTSVEASASLTVRGATVNIN